jgi:hypothetical protein
MPDNKQVILIGLSPDVVDYAKHPGLTADKLRAALDADRSRLQELGYAAQICFVDPGRKPLDTVRAALADKRIGAVLIGAGVRGDPAQFVLFEALVNLVHTDAPQARICFNTGPTDSVAAVQRWL